MLKKREYSFDVMRVIAMTMVVVIHVSNVYARCYGLIDNVSYLISLFFNTISRVSVPLFFMISGALLLDRKFDKKKYFRRVLKIIILIVFCDFFYLIWEYIYLGKTYHNLYLLLFDPFRNHLWFLYTIVILYLFQPIIKVVLDKCNKYLKIVILVLWLSLCFFSMYNDYIVSHFKLFIYMGYFVFGNFLYKYISKKDLSIYNSCIVVFIILSLLASVFLNYYASLKFNMFYNSFFAYRTPYVVLSSVLCFILIYNIFSNKKANKYVIKLSDLSLGIYLIHGVFLDITMSLFNYCSIFSLIGIPVFSFVIMLFSACVVYLLKKIKIFRFFF